MDSIKELYETYEKYIFRYLYGLTFDFYKAEELTQEYSKDELKIDEFKEDLPQADTFKKWMKKLKVWGSITIGLALVAAIAIGAIGYKIGEKPKNDLLTLKTIVKTLERHGVSITENKSKLTEEFALNGVKPAVFSIGEDKGTLLVYTFKSFVEREEVAGSSGKFKNQFSLLETSFNAKNSFLVYTVPEIPTTEEEMRKIGETKTLISNIVFKHLNDGKEIIYKGESANWEGTFTLKYYDHWWQDETDKLNFESYSENYPVIKYKSSDTSTVGPVDFEYKTNGGGGRRFGEELDKDGYLKLGRSGGYGGAKPGKDDNINFIIRWSGKEESIILKAE